jgi:hypothetical protein
VNTFYEWRVIRSEPRKRMPELQGEKPTYCVSGRFIFFINAGQFADWRSSLSNGQKNMFKLIG